MINPKFRRTFRVALSVCGLAALALASRIAVPRAGAWPSTSPSARASARLKYFPPRNWIRHYLGDDRYKIVGGTWKVVSTQYDVYYHRANCPNMIRQSPGIVIGFNSVIEAREAGYKPDAFCNPDAGSVRYAMSSVGDSDTTINRSRHGIRITLADGRSTALLPPSWKRTRSGAQTIAGYATRADTLEPLRGNGMVRFAFVNAPAAVNAQTLLQPANFSTTFKSLKATGGVTPEAARIVENSTVSAGRAGGLSGVRLTPAAGKTRRIFTVVARGSKIYSVEQSSSAAGAIIASFRPR